MRFLKELILNLSLEHPKKVLFSGFLITLFFLSAFPFLKTDTDPVHMLPQNNPAVVLHNKVKQEFEVADVVAIGFQSVDGSSLFNESFIKRLDEITKEILQIDNIFEKRDLLSISTVDDIKKNSKGELIVDKLMTKLPKNESESRLLLEKINNNPMLKGKLASEKGNVIGIFIPLLEGKKDQSYKLSQKVKSILEGRLNKNEIYHFAGLPVAESTFGNEMFLQMAVFAPMAGLVIFILLLIFFRSVKVVSAPMILSFMAVIWSMGALIMSGNVIHIMSSMIPVFIMPIAVLDSVHILSVLSDKMGAGLKKKSAVKETIEELFTPMLYTSLTTVVGFASLAGTGIPPVVVFGVTIAFGVAISFLLTIIFIPAYAVLLKDGAFENFGLPKNKVTFVDRITNFFKFVSWKYAKGIILVSLIVLIVSIVGVTRITINDNPVRWFKPGHELRVADVEMNKALAGTYMANLVFSIDGNESKDKKDSKNKEVDEFSEFENLEEPGQIDLKHPKVIAYMNKISEFLVNLKGTDGKALIGDTTGLNDIVTRVGEVAFSSGDVPKTKEGVSQYLFLFETGDTDKGRDLWKLMKRDAKESQMWVHFKSGDNQKMTYVEESLKDFMKTNPPPLLVESNGSEAQVKVEWSGLMHINNVWQNEMVKGMGNALIGSFVIVFFMMMFLFRSVKWAFIAMIPLSLTIAFIYGAIGFSGKFYDMPIAVLSSLTLGLSIDFAIHFIEHIVSYNKKLGGFEKAFNKMFQGTSQAIWRNVMVIAIGFTPLFFAALQPYFTVGLFFFLIMIISGVSTLVILPSIIKIFSGSLFKNNKTGERS